MKSKAEDQQSLADKKKKIEEQKLLIEKKKQELELKRKEREGKKQEFVSKGQLANTIVDSIAKDIGPTAVKSEGIFSSPTKSQQKLEFSFHIGLTSVPPTEKPDTHDLSIQVDLKVPGASPSKENNEELKKLKVANISKPKDELPPELQNIKLRGRRKSTHEPPQQNQVAKEKTAENVEKKSPNDENWQNFLNNSNFKNFILDSAKVIEKAINKPFTLVEDEMNLHNLLKEEKKAKIWKSQTFVDRLACENKCANYLEWSPVLSNIFMGIYCTTEKNASLLDTEGTILGWNIDNKQRPEFYCLSQATITAACFHPTQNQIIIGGLSTGQMVLWDLRVKHHPCFKTQIEPSIHTFSINQVKVNDNLVNNKVVSLSLDGRLSQWNLENQNELNHISTITFNKENKNEQAKSINPTCITFKKNNFNNFYMGTESGGLFECILQPDTKTNSNDPSKNENKNIVKEFDAHDAPVTSINILESNLKDPKTNGLILSSSYDWTVNLYHPTDLNRAVMTFDTAEDYINDVMWNPMHPAMFVTCDCDGSLQLYDLLKDTDYPIEYIKDEKKSGILQNKWNKEGKSLIASSTNGEIDLYSIGKEALKYSGDRVQEFNNFLLKTINDKKDEKPKR